MIFWWVACRIPVAQEEPLLHVYDTEVIEAQFAIEEIQIESDDAIASLPLYNAASVMQSYHTLATYTDEQCPTLYEIDGNAFWYGYCTSQEGLQFNGYLFFNAYENYDVFSDGSQWDLEVLSSSSDLSHNDAGTAHYAGNAYFGEGINPDGASVYLSILQGSFLVEPAPEEWLNDGFSSLLTLYGLRYDTPMGAGRAFSINGSIPYDGEYVRALAFSNMVVYDEIFGYPCRSEPQGSIAIRNTQGAWLDLTFDVDAS